MLEWFLLDLRFLSFAIGKKKKHLSKMLPTTNVP
jgi:hypothetical protein